MGDGASTGVMQSVRTTLGILEEVATRQPVGVSELARVTNMPKSSVQRCLVTLQQTGWLRLVDEERARWGVATKLLSVGLRAANDNGLREVAAPMMKQLSEQTNETIHLAIRDSNSLIITAREDSAQAVRTYVELGQRAPLHGTACGLAILAELDDAEVTAIIHQGLEPHTETTITDKDTLQREITLTRRRGYAVNTAGWWRPHVTAVGAAIFTPTGQATAAFAISIPSMRFDPDAASEYGQLAVTAAEQVSARLAGRG